MYIAHTREIDPKVQSIKEHLENTASKAKQFGDSFDNGEYTYACGLTHDIGKYSNEFQQKIKNNSNNRVDHSTAGAIEVNKRVNLFGKLMAYCIAGHHGGLPDGGNKSDTAIETTLNGRLKRAKQIPDYSCFEREINISNCLPVEIPNIKPLNRGGIFIILFYKDDIFMFGGCRFFRY